MILHYPDVTLIMKKTSWRRHLGDSHRRFYLDVTPARMAILLLYIYIYPAKYCRLARLPSRIIIGRLPDLLRCLHSIHLFWYTWKDLLVYIYVCNKTHGLWFSINSSAPSNIFDAVLPLLVPMVIQTAQCVFHVWTDRKLLPAQYS